MSPPEQPAASTLRRRRIQFVLLALLFMAPVIAAWVVWQYVGAHGIGTTTNAGELVVPARPLATSGLLDADGQPLDQRFLQGRWTYLLLAPDGCGERCERQLLDSRQVRLSVNKDMPRVRRVLVLPQAPAGALRERLASEHPDLSVVLAPAGAPAGAVAEIGAAGLSTDGAAFFLVDPLGNLMMAYDAGVPLQGVLKDLRKLLKVSQIG
jgi:hypothetical protein